MLIFIGILALIVLIVVHELGHFIAAKKLGVKVEEFGIGLPPRIFGKKIGETIYSLNWLPFGGFVRIYGHESPVKGDPRSFSEKPFWKKSIIILGGVLVFWVVSAIILSIVMVMGVPTVVEDHETENIINPKVQITSVLSDSPASSADLALGDIILEIRLKDSQGVGAIDKVGQIQSFSQTYKGEEFILTIQRGSEVFDTSLMSQESEDPPMGIGLARTALVKYPWYMAPIKGVQATANLTVAIIVSWGMVFSNIFSGQGLPPGVEVTGPIGIFQLFDQVGSLGASYFLQFIALIAIHLALINSLPLPALDGGWFFFMVIEKIKRKPLNQLFVQRISTTFFFLLIALMIWITVRDIIRIF